MRASKNLLFSFIEDYEKGEVLKAFQLILTDPSLSYDTIAPSDTPLRYLIHYVDASVFKGIFETYITNQILRHTLTSDVRLAERAQTFLENLEFESSLLHDSIFKEKLIQEGVPYLTIEDLENTDEDFLHLIPSIFRELSSKRQSLIKRWQTFKEQKSLFAQIIEDKREITWHIPWQPFSYPAHPVKQDKLSPGKTPLILLEPLEGVNYNELLAPYSKEKAIFVFETKASFLQFFQFPQLIAHLINPKNFIYILNLYPEEQLTAQSKWLSKEQISVQPIFQSIPASLKSAFTSCFNQPRDHLQNDNLYKLSKELLFQKRILRYGDSRLLVLSLQKSDEMWFDQHKWAAPIEDDRDSEKVNFEKMAHHLNVNRIARALQPKKQLKIAHVTSQLVDGGHAPTRLLSELVLNGDQKKFKFTVISTERVVPRPLEYPLDTYTSKPSTLRGKETIETFEKNGIQVFVDENSSTYEQTIQKVLKLINDLEIDIAIFHGPDEVNALISNTCSSPYRVLFDHGSLSYPYAFDYIVFSSDELYRKWKEKGVKGSFLHFSVDCRSTWEKKPYTKKELGFPEDSFIMTTISNHLDTRLNFEMCQAIGEILKMNPRAFYAPIGKVDNQEKLMKIFASFGCADRVRFLGLKINPSQYARSFDLYLNEFPIGSGLGILDAMASGCPVVSMYDPKGPPQAIFGASHFGKDWVIATGSVEEYIDLASRLIQDKKLYKKWSKHALEQYEKFADVKAYVKSFEDILLKLK